jgi:hypothetical protein
VPETPRRLEVEALDLGMGVRGVLFELIDSETRAPVTGPEAAQIWAAILPALAAGEPWAFDFFAHLERVRDFLRFRGVAFRESGIVVVENPQTESVPALIERFEGETFGVRSGAPVTAGDAPLEDALARRGVDAYQEAYSKYSFCAICDFENGFLTVLSEHLWASEAIRRAKAALQDLQVEVARPQ